MGCGISNPVPPLPLSDQAKPAENSEAQVQPALDLPNSSSLDVVEEVREGPDVMAPDISSLKEKGWSKEGDQKEPKENSYRGLFAEEALRLDQLDQLDQSRQSNLPMSSNNHEKYQNTGTQKNVLKVNNKRSKLSFTLNNSRDISRMDMSPVNAQNNQKLTVHGNSMIQNLLAGDVLTEQMLESDGKQAGVHTTLDNSGNECPSKEQKNKAQNVSLRDQSQEEINRSILKEKLRSRRGDKLIDTSIYDCLFKGCTGNHKKKDQLSNCISENHSLQSSIFSSSCKSGILKDINPQKFKSQYAQRNITEIRK